MQPTPTTPTRVRPTPLLAATPSRVHDDGAVRAPTHHDRGGGRRAPPTTTPRLATRRPTPTTTGGPTPTRAPTPLARGPTPLASARPTTTRTPTLLGRCAPRPAATTLGSRGVAATPAATNGTLARATAPTLLRHDCLPAAAPTGAMPLQTRILASAPATATLDRHRCLAGPTTLATHAALALLLAAPLGRPVRGERRRHAPLATALGRTSSAEPAGLAPEPDLRATTDSSSTTAAATSCVHVQNGHSFSESSLVPTTRRRHGGRFVIQRNKPPNSRQPLIVTFVIKD